MKTYTIADWIRQKELARNGAARSARPQDRPPPEPEPWPTPIPLSEMSEPPPFPLDVLPDRVMLRPVPARNAGLSSICNGQAECGVEDHPVTPVQ